MHILCDIEGTLGSIRFVRDVLFPYAARELPAFVRAHQTDPSVSAELAKVAAGLPPDQRGLDAVLSQLDNWMRSDTKATPLKALQGMVWVEGYAKGMFKGHLYPDAHRQLLAWRNAGHSLAIYSSGSVAAQQLYFRYSDYGDLRALFDGWFDTTTGSKQEPASYTRIAAELRALPEDCLFLSDAPAELDAASEAGLFTTWIRRPEDAPEVALNPRAQHPVAASFDEVRLSK